MSNLQILSNSIRQLDNLYSLNDLHRAGGGESKHQPSFFARLETTQELIAEFEKQTNTTALKTLRGTQGGTYACKELVIAYAAWISPAFHLTVLRAFLDKAENLQNSQPSLPLVEEKKYQFELTETELISLAWAWFAFVRGIHTFRYIYPMFQKLGSNIAPEIYGQGFEYCDTARNAHAIISRLTQDIEIDYSDNSRVLKHLREFDPMFKKPTF